MKKKTKTAVAFVLFWLAIAATLARVATFPELEFISSWPLWAFICFLVTLLVMVGVGVLEELFKDWGNDKLKAKKASRIIGFTWVISAAACALFLKISRINVFLDFATWVIFLFIAGALATWLCGLLIGTEDGQ